MRHSLLECHRIPWTDNLYSVALAVYTAAGVRMVRMATGNFLMLMAQSILSNGVAEICMTLLMACWLL